MRNLPRLLKRPSPAMVVACLALTIALSGTGYAVSQLPRNSVGTLQLKNDAVVGSKVKKDSLAGVDVNEGSLRGIPITSLVGARCSGFGKTGVFQIGFGFPSQNSGVSPGSLWCLTADDYEPDNTKETAGGGVDAVGADYAQTIFPAGDEDWFRFSLSDPPPAVVDFIQVTSAGGRVRMDIQAGSGPVVENVREWQNEEDPSTGPWTIRVHAPVPDSYTLTVATR